MAKFKFFILATVFFGLFSCNGEHEENFGNQESETPENNSHKELADSIFKSIPDPKIITQVIDESNLEYNPDLLNDPTRYANYSSEASKALNFGVYGTDLTLTGMFEQTQESLVYLKCVNQLSKSLGIEGAFNETTSERIEANKNHRDSILNIISSSFTNADQFLIKNKRGYASSLILAGGWIEGIFISTSICSEIKTPLAIKQISAQKNALKNLQRMMVSYGLKTNEAKKINTELISLKILFDSLKPESEIHHEHNLNIISKMNQQIKPLREYIITL